ncbi:MAG TPA: hypothetical protein VFR21_19525, partial [Bradyrhizobium sp.]|nr:hypothetical protein [Bradyrhizobium sp.]
MTVERRLGKFCHAHAIGTSDARFDCERQQFGFHHTFPSSRLLDAHISSSVFATTSAMRPIFKMLSLATGLRSPAGGWLLGRP